MNTQKMSATQIKQFIQQVSQHFGAPADELQAMWDTLSIYTKMKKQELVQECLEKEMAITGTKQDLINRLQGNPETEAPKKAKKPRKKKTFPIETLSSIETHSITMNDKDQWVHEPSGFVFQENKREAKARIVDGIERLLTVDDIPECKALGFEWIL